MKLLVIRLSVVEGNNDADAVYEAQKSVRPEDGGWMYPIKDDTGLTPLEMALVQTIETHGAIAITSLLPQQKDQLPLLFPERG